MPEFFEAIKNNEAMKNYYSNLRVLEKAGTPAASPPSAFQDVQAIEEWIDELNSFEDTATTSEEEPGDSDSDTNSVPLGLGPQCESNDSIGSIVPETEFSGPPSPLNSGSLSFFDDALDESGILPNLADPSSSPCHHGKAIVFLPTSPPRSLSSDESASELEIGEQAEIHDYNKINQIANAMLRLQGAEDTMCQELRQLLKLSPEISPQLEPYMSPNIKARLQLDEPITPKTAPSPKTLPLDSNPLQPFDGNKKEPRKVSYNIHFHDDSCEPGSFQRVREMVTRASSSLEKVGFHPSLYVSEEITNPEYAAFAPLPRLKCLKISLYGDGNFWPWATQLLSSLSHPEHLEELQLAYTLPQSGSEPLLLGDQAHGWEELDLCLTTFTSSSAAQPHPATHRKFLNLETVITGLVAREWAQNGEIRSRKLAEEIPVILPRLSALKLVKVSFSNVSGFIHNSDCWYIA
ncbi:hypothetical protein BDN72DRAFT_897374 [Pluteus cervinus]|uniref:Uncharacterized protein n=1 Tax=Pluteus cervinus TaxID=181527 RepID=A0ACD3AUM2_9AGAR|nr:hypothetical protein BDN72DRAFT_897374 [Pluteus cervinus]